MDKIKAIKALSAGLFLILLSIITFGWVPVKVRALMDEQNGGVFGAIVRFFAGERSSEEEMLKQQLDDAPALPSTYVAPPSNPGRNTSDTDMPWLDGGN